MAAQKNNHHNRAFSVAVSLPVKAKTQIQQLRGKKNSDVIFVLSEGN